jgi:hypothetical protein
MSATLAARCNATDRRQFARLIGTRFASQSADGVTRVQTYADHQRYSRRALATERLASYAYHCDAKKSTASAHQPAKAIVVFADLTC